MLRLTGARAVSPETTNLREAYLLTENFNSDTQGQAKRIGAWPFGQLLGDSWVVLSKVISRVTILITHLRGFITPLITIHEPGMFFEPLLCYEHLWAPHQKFSEAAGRQTSSPLALR